MKIGIIRERKNPPDRRVALTPEQCAQLKDKYSNLDVIVESSPDRIFPDQAYLHAGISVVKDLSNCDILLGIKEVPVEHLIPNKTYLFFSHTIKAQLYNQDLLQAVLKNNIRLIDYECLEYPKGRRILGFGFWAGVVGAYNALLTWGKKTGDFDLKPAYECRDYHELKEQLSSLKGKLFTVRVALTGNGRVAGGSLEVLRYLGIREVEPEEFGDESRSEMVFTNLMNFNLYRRIDSNEEWDTQHYYNHHDQYEGIFRPYINCTDILINGFYWEPTMPALFTKEDTARDDFAIKVIADITCDVEGSVPITLRATYPEDPTFGWDPKTQKETEPFTSKSIDVMAVTVLPAELPADSSADFGETMLEEILPLFIEGDDKGILDWATIAENGKLTQKYSYLEDFVRG